MSQAQAVALTAEDLQLLIPKVPFAAHTRDIKTQQYAMVNQPYAHNQAFSQAQAIKNMKAKDLYAHRYQRLTRLQGSIQLEMAYQRAIEEANHRVEIRQAPYSFQVCTLAPTGFIYIANLYKMPLIDRHHKVSAILTFSQDITPYINLKTLYDKYQKHYPVKQAIVQFLHYVDIAHYFAHLPTHQEVVALVFLSQDGRSKGVARNMKINYRTVEEYKARLRAKLKQTISLDRLLILLRKAPFDHLSETVAELPVNAHCVDYASSFYHQQENKYAPFETQILHNQRER